jgi:hypothetical protein
LRIDIDSNPHAAALGRSRGKPCPQKSLKIRRARRPHQETEAVASTDNGDWRFGWPEKGQLVFLW